MAHEIPAFLPVNETETYRVPDLPVPVEISIGPVVGRDDNGDISGWHGYIYALGCEFWGCEHIHEEKAQAWICAAVELRKLWVNI